MDDQQLFLKGGKDGVAFTAGKADEATKPVIKYQ